MIKRLFSYFLFMVIGFLISNIVLIGKFNDQIDTITLESKNLATSSYYRGCAIQKKNKNNDCLAQSQFYKNELTDTYEDVEIISINGNEKGQKLIENKRKLKNLKDFNEIMKRSSNDLVI